jgi:hypothetical protein
VSLREVELDKRGLEYVVDHLRGVNALCTTLLSVVEGTRGRVFTMLPDDADDVRAHDFASGGLLKANRDFSRAISLGPGRGSLMAVVDLAEVRAGLILDGLAANPGSVCLCDDYNPRWSDAIAREPSTAFGVGDETYHLLTTASGLGAITDTLRMTDTVWHSVAAVCLGGLRIPSDRSVDVGDLERCAVSVVEITCTAYDREGFVAWRRTV